MKFLLLVLACLFSNNVFLSIIAVDDDVGSNPSRCQILWAHFLVTHEVKGQKGYQPPYENEQLKHCVSFDLRKGLGNTAYYLDSFPDAYDGALWKGSIDRKDPIIDKEEVVSYPTIYRPFKVRTLKENETMLKEACVATCSQDEALDVNSVQHAVGCRKSCIVKEDRIASKKRADTTKAFAEFIVSLVGPVEEQNIHEYYRKVEEAFTKKWFVKWGEDHFYPMGKQFISFCKDNNISYEEWLFRTFNNVLEPAYWCFEDDQKNRVEGSKTVKMPASEKSENFSMSSAESPSSTRSYSSSSSFDDSSGLSPSERGLNLWNSNAGW